MNTIGEILKKSTLFLDERKISRPRRLAEELLGSALGMKRLALYLHFDQPVEERELATLRGWIKRLIQGEPLEYITGEVEFYGIQVQVDSRVLIPRPETEILADLVAKKVEKSLFNKVLFDVCTGSGCLGIALKKKFSELTVVLSDLSKEALVVARRNVSSNGVEVEILEGDLFAPFGERRADFIVCNPPYISSSEYIALDLSVCDFEPKMALVGGEKGIEFYERLAFEVPVFLRPGGALFLEIGACQGDAVQEIFSSPIWAKRELIRDWSGKDRFFFLEKQ